MMSKSSAFMELLHLYITDYLPVSVGASKNTIKSYKYAFRLLLKYLNQYLSLNADEISFDILNYQTITGFLDWLESERNCSISTKNQRLSALLSFSEYAQNRNFEAASTFRSAVIKIPMKKSPHKLRAVFTIDEVSKLLSLPDDNFAIGRRDKVLLSFMYASGARAQEVCDLTVNDISFNRERASVILHGKGGKIRRIGISKSCTKMMEKYIEYRKLFGKPDRHIFGSQTHEQMTVSCIEEIFKKYIAIAKAKYPELYHEASYTPHSMRHSTASHMLEAGVPIMVIKNFLGHVSIQSTQIYAELSQSTVDKHIIEWNEKWFGNKSADFDKLNQNSDIPEFLKV